MLNKLSSYYHQFSEWRKTDTGIKVLKWFDRFVTFSLLALLVYQLYGRPLEEILKSLPTHPLFYLLWLIIFFIVPVSEYLIYQFRWDYKGKEIFKGFMLKKIYNNEVYNYSGEVFFTQWIADKLGLTVKEALFFVKDNNIVSSIASTSWAFLTLFILSAFGYFDLLKLLSESDLLIRRLGIIFLILAFVVIWRFRKNILHIDRKLFFKLFLAYTARFLFRHAVLLWMWILAAPQVSISIWLNFMTIKILLDRIPIGNRSLILLSLSPWLSTNFSLSKEIFTGIMISITVIDKAASAIALVWAKKQPSSNL